MADSSNHVQVTEHLAGMVAAKVVAELNKIPEEFYAVVQPSVHYVQLYTDPAYHNCRLRIQISNDGMFILVELDSYLIANLHFGRGEKFFTENPNG